MPPLGLRRFADMRNFFLLRPPPRVAAQQVYDALIEKYNLVVRRYEAAPGLDNLLRITVGLPRAQRFPFVGPFTDFIMNVAFLDRDGTLIWEPPETEQIDSLAKLRVLPGVFEGLAALRDPGYALVLVSNQDGLGTPRFPREAFKVPHAELLRQLEQHGITLAETFICPHMAADGSHAASRARPWSTTMSDASASISGRR